MSKAAYRRADHELYSHTLQRCRWHTHAGDSEKRQFLSRSGTAHSCEAFESV